MLRHKKEQREHQLMKMRRELDAFYRSAVDSRTHVLKMDKHEINVEEDRICKKYGFSFDNRDESMRYFSHVIHKPNRTNPKHDSNRRIRRAVINHNTKPLKQQFKEQINEYDKHREEYDYADGNY